MIDLLVTSTGNYNVCNARMLGALKSGAVVCNIGHFDNEIEMSYLDKNPNCKKTPIKPQVDKWTLASGRTIVVLAEGRLVNLGCATGHPSFVMSNSFTNQVLAQMELWNHGERYDNQVYVLPKHLDEMVARLHLQRIGATLTELSEEQAKYIGVEVEGPFKPEHYRY